MDGYTTNKLTKNKKIFFLCIGIVLVCLLVVGGTYAYMTLSFNASNGKYNAGTTCFLVDYNITNDDGTSPITGTLLPSSRPVGGLFGKVSMKISDDCNVNGTGTLTLNVTSGSDTLFQTVSSHCENSQTLMTLTDYTTSSTCTAQTNGKWVTSGTALKYAIYNTSNVTSSSVPVKVGYVTDSTSIKLYEGFNLTKTAITYYIYIWLDGNVSDNSYTSLSFKGNISASAIQTDK